MNNEFKKLKTGSETRYTLESMTAGATGVSSVATATGSLGKVQKRGNILAQEADKKKETPKPRNFVAKNAKMGGAGQHKDKKKAAKQGDVKHKNKDVAEAGTLDRYRDRIGTSGQSDRYRDSQERRHERNQEYDDASHQSRLNRMSADDQNYANWRQNQSDRDAHRTTRMQKDDDDWDKTFDMMRDRLNRYQWSSQRDVDPEQLAAISNIKYEPKKKNEAAQAKTDDKLLAYYAQRKAEKQKQQQGVEEGVAETVPLWDAQKVLNHYGADYFGTTFNKLYFYKNRKQFSIGLIRNDDLADAGSVNLSDLNTMVRKLRDMRNPMPYKEGFNHEYDDEAGMAHSNLLTTARAVIGLLKTIKDRDNLPEWGQEKIAKAEMMLVSVWDYLQSQKEMGNDPQQGVAEGIRADYLTQVFDQILDGELDAYDVMNHPQGSAQEYVAMVLQDMYDDVARENRLHPDDNFEEILDIVVDRIENDYGHSADRGVAEGVAGPKSCWPGHRKVGTKPGTGKNAGKRVNDCEKIKEDEVEESGLQYYTGVKKHGEKYMKAAAAAGRKGASQEELGALKDKLSKAHKGKDVAEAPEDRTSYQVAKILTDRGITYNPAQENELINAIGMVLVKDLNMTPKQARHLISYDEDFVSDTLGELRSMEQSVSEVAPPGWEKTVKAMKKHDDIDNPYALAWSMKNKGYKSHKKESADPYFESLASKLDQLKKK